MSEPQLTAAERIARAHLHAVRAMEDVTSVLEALQDGHRRFNRPLAVLLSPTMLCGLILTAAGLAAFWASDAFLAPGSDLASVVGGVSALAGLVGFLLIGIFFGAGYVAVRGGEHPDATVARIWRQRSRRHRLAAAREPRGLFPKEEKQTDALR